MRFNLEPSWLGLHLFVRRHSRTFNELQHPSYNPASDPRCELQTGVFEPERFV